MLKPINKWSTRPDSRGCRQVVGPVGALVGQRDGFARFGAEQDDGEFADRPGGRFPVTSCDQDATYQAFRRYMYTTSPRSLSIEYAVSRFTEYTVSSGHEAEQEAEARRCTRVPTCAVETLLRPADGAGHCWLAR